jgi:hypothetical protein
MEWDFIERFFKDDNSPYPTLPPSSDIPGGNDPPEKYNEKVKRLLTNIKKSATYIYDYHNMDHETFYVMIEKISSKQIPPISKKNLKLLCMIINHEKETPKVYMDRELNQVRNEEEEEEEYKDDGIYQDLIEDLIVYIQDSLYYENGVYKFKPIPVRMLVEKHKVNIDIVRAYRYRIRKLFFNSRTDLSKNEYRSLVRVTLIKEGKEVSSKGLINQLRFFNVTNTQLAVKPIHIVGHDLRYSDAFRFLYYLQTSFDRPFLYTYNIRRFFKTAGIRELIMNYTGIKLSSNKKDVNYNLYMNNHLKIVT